MAFLAFLCCSSSDRPSKLDAKARHARIVAVTNDLGRHNVRPSQPCEYQDNPPEYKDAIQQPLITIDEKIPIDFQMTVQDEDGMSPPPSPRSSVVSIPSTRLTDLTAARTGETTRTSRRASLERVSTRGSLPPPSYSSRRSPSPASSTGAAGEGERDAVWQHPVMSSNWLEILRQDAVAQNSQRRDNHDRNGNDTRGAGFG